MEDKNRRFPVNGLRICVDDCGRSELSGRIYSRLLMQPLTFQNCGEMILKADSMFDEKGYPQAFQQKRTFAKDREKTGSAYCVRPLLLSSEQEIQQKTGRCATYDVIIQTRRKAGWQGYIRNVSDSGPMVAFDSEFKMLKELEKEIVF